MSKRSRDRILSRLHGAGKQVSSPESLASGLPFEKLGRDEKIDKLKGFMEAVRTEVHVVEAQNWIDPLKGILKKREIKTLLYAPQTIIGDTLQKHWPGEDDNAGLPELVTYDGHIENFKDNERIQNMFGRENERLNNDIKSLEQQIEEIKNISSGI